MDNPTHKLSAYLDGRNWIAFCKVCSREGDLLAEACPGEYVSSLVPIRVDSEKEPK